MAQLHNQLTRGPWTTAIKAALGLSKSEGGVERFGETMQPVLDIWGGPQPEWCYLRGEWLWSVQGTASAVAAEGSMIAVVNPVANSNIAVIEKCNAIGGAAGTVALGLATEAQITATLATGLTLRTKDTRWARGLVPPVALGFVPLTPLTGADPTLTFDTSLENIAVLTAEFRPFNTLPYVLAPGTAIWIQHQTVNTALSANFSGRVRAAFPGELGAQ